MQSRLDGVHPKWAPHPHHVEHARFQDAVADLSFPVAGARKCGRCVFEAVLPQGGAKSRYFVLGAVCGLGAPGGIEVSQQQDRPVARPSLGHGLSQARPLFASKLGPLGLGFEVHGHRQKFEWGLRSIATQDEGLGEARAQVSLHRQRVELERRTRCLQSIAAPHESKPLLTAPPTATQRNIQSWAGRPRGVGEDAFEHAFVVNFLNREEVGIECEQVLSKSGLVVLGVWVAEVAQVPGGDPKPWRRRGGLATHGGIGCAVAQSVHEVLDGCVAEHQSGPSNEGRHAPQAAKREPRGATHELRGWAHASVVGRAGSRLHGAGRSGPAQP